MKLLSDEAKYTAIPSMSSSFPISPDAARRLGDTGRVLVRPSGTEPALRVMVEGPDESLVTELADTLATLVGERLD